MERDLSGIMSFASYTMLFARCIMRNISTEKTNKGRSILMSLIKNFFLYVILLPSILIIAPIVDFLVYMIFGIVEGWKIAFYETRDTYRTILAEYKDRWGA